MKSEVIDLVEPFLSDDQKKWGKLSSELYYRRLELLLLREIVMELKKLNRASGRKRTALR
jgi:hypothetical protein